MASEACTTPALRSSASSASPAGSAATCVLGSLAASDRLSQPAAAAARTSTHSAPASLSTMAPGTAAANPEKPPRRARRRVRLDQFGVGVDDRRHEGAPGDGVGLAEHEDDEGLGEQQEAVDVPGHQQARHRPADAGPDHEQAPPAGHPVERRAHQRADDGERRDRQQQVERDPSAGLTGRDREEQRPGERGGDERVDGRRQGVDPGEPGERPDGRERSLRVARRPGVASRATATRSGSTPPSTVASGVWIRPLGGDAAASARRRPRTCSRGRGSSRSASGATGRSRPSSAGA